MADGTPMTISLDALLRPESVAVIGASGSPDKIGGKPVQYLKEMGYTGRLLPINPKSDEIQGVPAYKSILDAPGPVDLAIVAVPAALAEQALKDCVTAGVKSVVMFSAGFAEIGGEGVAAQERLKAIAREGGLRLLGPNCLGFMNLEHKLFATFAPVVQMGLPKKGRIALLSQSGAFGGFAFSVARERGMGLSQWITTGNEADLGFAECLEWLATDPATDIIVGYMEGCRDGDALRRAFAACRKAGKPVIVTKVGSTEEGAMAAASHTAALAGEDAVFDGIFKQYGVYRAESIEECLDIAYAATVAGLPRGRRVGLYTVSGGAGVLMADTASAHGLEVPELTAETQDKVRAIIPFAGARNPLDITGQVTSVPDAFRDALALLAGDGTVDMVVSFVSASGLTQAGLERISDFTSVRDSHPEVSQIIVTLPTPQFREAAEAAGIPIFSDPNRAVKVAAALARIAQTMRATPSTALPTKALPLAVPARCTEPEALRLLSGAGLPVVPFALCTTPEEAGAAADRLGGKVVAKIVSPDILHKSDIGGVRLGLEGRAETEAAAREILAAAAEHAPGAELRGLMVAPMVKGVAECVIGVQRDPAFGPVVMFGLGGIHVEVLKDVVFRAAPFDSDTALEMIHALRAKALLTNPRGSRPADIPALADLLARVSRIAAASPELDSADMNPVLVMPEGEGAMLLDALLIRSA